MNKKALIGLASAAVCAAAISAPTLAQADPVDQDVGMRPYISIMASETFSDAFRQGHNRESKNGYGGYLGFGAALTRHIGWELGGFYSTFAPNGSVPRGSWREYGAEFQALFFPYRDPVFSPYLVLGVGGARNVSRLSDEQDTSLLGDFGLGAMSFFHIGSLPVGVRLDARYRWIGLDPTHFNKFDAANGERIANLAEPVLSVGLVFPLGSGPKAAPPPPPPPPPMTIENTTAPPPAVEKANPNRKFANVHFAFDKSLLSEYAKASLDGDAKTVNKLTQDYPKLEVDVDGHTDWIGTDAYNQALSERRANAVSDYLQMKGVDATRIHTHAYGESKPIAPNTTAEGRALNRRAEIRTKNP